MAAITTILATLASVGETFVSGWLESRGDQLISNTPDFAKRVIAQFHDTKIPVNNDLQKAIASSHWLATKVFCEKLKKNNPTDILDSILRVVKKRLAQINQKGYLLPEKDKQDDFEADLLILKENGKEAPGILKNKVVAYLLKELKSLLKEREADSVGFATLENAIINGLADENFEWFDLVCAFLNELLKVDSRAKGAFQNQELAKMGQAIGELGELKKTLETITNGFVAKIGEERFEELKILVEEELKIVKEVVFRIDETTTKTLEIVKEIRGELLNPPLKFAQKLTPIPALGTFIGRDEDLAELGQILAAANQVVLVNGMGGIGKTTLARAYINRNLSAFNYIAWISVTGDNIKEAFVNAEYFDETLQKAQLKEGDNNARFMAIIKSLNNLQGTGLLIIDNAEEDIEDIRQFLPPPPQWQILLTSRFELKAFKEVRLEKLSPGYAEEVFKEYYGKPIRKNDYKIFQSLLKEIDYHTLTIELIAKTIRESDNSLKFDEVLDKLQQRQLDHRRMREVIKVSHLNDKQTVLYEHLMTSFNLAQLSEYEIWLLKQFTALPPEPILKDTLIEWLQLDENETLELEQALKTLRSKGWLKRTDDEDGNVQYTIHRLIQDMVHYQFGISFEDIMSLISTFQKILYSNSSTNFTLKFPYLHFAEYILNSLPIALENIAIAQLYNNLGVTYRHFPNLEKARKHLLKSLEIRKKYGDELEVAISYANLALVHKDLGDYVQAKELLELALESDIKIFGNTHPNVAINQSNLATVNQDLGNYKQAKELLELALVANIKNFGSTHHNVTLVQSNLASVNSQLGNYKKAKELFELVLKSEIENFGPNHPNVSRSRSNLALVNQKFGNYKQAAKLLELALKSDIENFGIKHPTVAIVQSNLAVNHQNLGNYHQAKKLLKLALETEIEIFGQNHPTVAFTQWNLAVTLFALKNRKEAKQLIESAYETFRNRLGESHPTTQQSLSWLNGIKKN